MDDLTPQAIRQIFKEELARFKEELLAELRAVPAPVPSANPLAALSIAEWIENHKDLPTRTITALREEFIDPIMVDGGNIPSVAILVGYARAGRLQRMRKMGKKGEAEILEKLAADGLYQAPTKQASPES
jgi:hypothetical protein